MIRGIRVHSKLSPAGGDTSRGGPPWAVSHRPHEAKQCDNLEYTQESTIILFFRQLLSMITATDQTKI